MTNINDKAPAGATHRYEHGGLIYWYRETDSGLFIWRDGSWFASFFKSAQDLAQSCMLGRVEAIPAMPALQAEDDLTWLARNITDRILCDWYSKSGDGYNSVVGNTPFGLSGTWFTRDRITQRRAELQNKPSWKDAPEWAGWLAQDSAEENGLGLWWWYKLSPEKTDDCWSTGEFANRVKASGQKGEVLGDWRDTLERRTVDCGVNHEEWVEKNAGKLVAEAISTLRSNPSYFSANELAELHQLCDAELTKRDAAVCGGENGKKFVLVLGDGTFGLVESGGLTWTLSLERATLMAEAGWDQFKRFGKLAEVRHGKLVMRVGGAA